MKTQQEKHYQKLIINMIEHQYYGKIEIKEQKLFDFFENEEQYYEIFCDFVYAFIKNKDTQLLTIDDNGKSYIDLHNKMPEHYYFDVLNSNDRCNDCKSEELIYYIDLALNRMEVMMEELFKTLKYEI